MFHGPGQYHSATAVTAPWAAGQAVGAPQPTPASLAQRLRLVQTHLQKVSGPADVTSRRDFLLRESSQVRQVLTQLGSNYNVTALQGLEQAVLRLEAATSALLGQQGVPLSGLGAAQQKQGIHRVPRYVWWGLGALGVGLLFYVFDRSSGGGRLSGLGALHDGKAQASSGFRDAVAAL
jgi:hypothetical protein